ncbi:hypothetical protein ACFFX0_01370 [Citricoccus parietis]|uniref:Uncharacterized protein n=1 Tax=Citricoccus parietis TaxID=592307 RepID=A0ABV5FTA3_9MICC
MDGDARTNINHFAAPVVTGNNHLIAHPRGEMALRGVSVHLRTPASSLHPDEVDPEGAAHIRDRLIDPGTVEHHHGGAQFFHQLEQVAAESVVPGVGIAVRRRGGREIADFHAESLHLRVGLGQGQDHRVTVARKPGRHREHPGDVSQSRAVAGDEEDRAGRTVVQRFRLPVSHTHPLPAAELHERGDASGPPPCPSASGPDGPRQGTSTSELRHHQSRMPSLLPRVSNRTALRASMDARS